MRSPLRLLFLSLFLLCYQLAFCWGLTGHRIIAEIAENHLSKKAKKELRKLIGRETLAWWANWPDFIKSDSNWRHASPWHYVDLPGHISKDSFLVQLRNLPGKTLYTQIPAMIAQLKDKSQSIEQRRSALAFVIHLIGDLHQPLHVGRSDDEGGNKITVYWFNEKTNLHSVWDTYLINNQQYSYTEYSHLLDIAGKEQVIGWQNSSLDDWFYESHQLSDIIYDSAPNESKLSYNYNFQFQQMLNDQLLKGGIRLAKVLNDALE
jgi:hypothetical protein